MQAPNTHYDPATGRMWTPFQMRYTHGGVTFILSLMATSHSHAEQILEDIKRTAVIQGELVAEEAV